MAEAKTLHITQVRSQIGRPADQGKTRRLWALAKSAARLSRLIRRPSWHDLQGQAPRRGC